MLFTTTNTSTGTAKETNEILQWVRYNINIKVINTTITDIITGGIGDSQKRIEQIFTNAKKIEPSCIILEDIHAIFGSREDENDYSRKVKLPTKLTLALRPIVFRTRQPRYTQNNDHRIMQQHISTRPRPTSLRKIRNNNTHNNKIS